MSPAFSAVSAVERAGPGRYTASIDDRWTIAGRPNGGYLLATLAHAATDGDASEQPHPHVIAASAHYLRATDPGSADIWVETLRAGRSAAQVRVRLSQQDVPCVEALFTLSKLVADTSPFWARGLPPRPDSQPGQGVRLRNVGASGVDTPIMDEVELRVDRDRASFLRGETTGEGELRGWLTLPDGEDFDPASLLFALDAFPPATLDVELTGWVPTLELTAYVRALPAPGPVQVMQRARLIEDGRVDEECWVWDSTGRTVAQATQLAAIRLG